ncbi:MAG: hypothetical protein AAF657_08010 [Acidobacteriota bacterium]
MAVNRLCLKATKKNPYDSRAHYGLSRCAKDANRLEAALTYIEHSLKHAAAGDKREYTTHRGNIFYQLSLTPGLDIEQHLHYLNRAVEDRSIYFAKAKVDRASLYFQLATRALDAGDLNRAIRYLDSAIEDHPGYLKAKAARGEAYYKLADHDRRRGDMEACLQNLSMALQDLPGHERARSERARAHFHFALQHERHRELKPPTTDFIGRERMTRTFARRTKN